MKPALIIMAAGMGSRFGGPKQITPVGDRGEIIMDFSLYDAWKAGFGKVVFIIKKEKEAEFRSIVGPHVERRMEVRYVYQEMEDLPAGFAVPEGRVKPFGTAHAVRAARHVIQEPFAVINADDFYGRGAFLALSDFLRSSPPPGEQAMVAYRLRNTVTENGHVARGVCRAEGGYLRSIVERTHIEKRGENAAFTEDGVRFTELPGDTLVSMNFWGFQREMMDAFDRRFEGFLREELPKNPLKAEYFLPSVANAEMEAGRARIRVLPCEETWHGVTYREDLPEVQNAVAQLKARGVYPPVLWEE
ncbi:MAG: nucleotidyltransferase [Oscillospiraceae bacterium]|nr:nucleotidyltransferase [Oscillospiraceae bacterium]